MRFWDVAKPEERPALELKNGTEDIGGFVLLLAYAPTGERLAIGRSGRPSIVVDTKKKEIAYSLGANTSSSFLAYAPDGKTIVGCLPPFPVLRLYRADDGMRLEASQSRGTPPPAYETLGKTPPTGVPVCARFSPDGKIIAAGCDDGAVYLFDSGLAKETGKFNVTGRVRALAFSPDGRLLVVAGSDRVHLFDAKTWTPVRTLSGQSGEINAIAFSPNGKVLAAACGSVRLWDAATGELVKDLK